MRQVYVQKWNWVVMLGAIVAAVLAGTSSAADVAARLAREGAPVPEGIEAKVIDNSGGLAEGIAGFVAALETIAE